MSTTPNLGLTLLGPDEPADFTVLNSNFEKLDGSNPVVETDVETGSFFTGQSHIAIEWHIARYSDGTIECETTIETNEIVCTAGYGTPPACYLSGKRTVYFPRSVPFDARPELFLSSSGGDSNVSFLTAVSGIRPTWMDIQLVTWKAETASSSAPTKTINILLRGR